MDIRTLSAPLLALGAALALSACTTESEPPAPATDTGTTDEASPETSVHDPAAVLEIEDQTSEGPTVRVADAAVTDGGFVVVAAEGGANILGFADVPAGTEPVTLQVSLADEVNEETELVAMLYRDDNASGLFDAGDRPVGNGEDDEDDDSEVFPGEREVFSFTGQPVVGEPTDEG